MRKILQLVLTVSLMLVLLPSSLQAQERTINGNVLSDDDGLPLEGVTVTNLRTQKGQQLPV